ncbi:MBL fold metallo-hydrolase [Alteribacillus sp. JSM 102045]|uniref:MBL fold metallo-hydrolase n=1 Tax=Alteribacillus sp. JSM 102045 TaxID=1562101 RepID=UPI0035C15524
MQQTLKENGYTTSDISSIILSHHHKDHCGLVNQLTEEQNIPVYAHKKSLPRLKGIKSLLEKRADFFKRLYQEFGCGEKGEAYSEYLTRSIEQNHESIINVNVKPIEEANLPMVEVLHLQGHAPDQIGLWEEDNGVLFGADALIDHISSNAFVEPDDNGERIPSLSQNIETLH